MVLVDHNRRRAIETSLPQLIKRLVGFLKWIRMCLCLDRRRRRKLKELLVLNQVGFLFALDSERLKLHQYRGIDFR